MHKMCIRYGEPYYVKPCRSADSHWCSRSCFYAWRRENAGIGCVCKQCGATFRRSPSVVKKGGGVYCSEACQYEGQSGSGCPLWGGGPVEQTCLMCGEQFTIKRHLAEKQRMCSPACRCIYYSQNYSGENSHLWRGGKGKKYPPAYSTSLRAAIIRRDGGHCQMCGDEEHLQVHHIDRDRHNNSEMNLVTLCRSCHSRITMSSDQDGWMKACELLVAHWAQGLNDHAS